MKKNTTKIKPKQLTEKRVREIAREEIDKTLYGYRKITGQIHQRANQAYLKNMEDL